MQEFSIGTTDAILIGQKSESVFLFLHGNGGSKEEAIAFAQVAVPHGYQVIGIDVPVMGKPWEVLKILEVVKDFLKKNYKSISIRANSIGAWFLMQAFNGEKIDQALFVSPLLDMKVFIERMPEGEEDYYNWVILLPIDQWNVPTFILRPATDVVVDESVYESFLANHDCHVEIAEEGEHWFHTPQQLNVMKNGKKQLFINNMRKMEKEWKLTSLDLFCLNMVIKGAWIYKELPDVQTMREALKKLIKYYPHLTGHYQEKGKVLIWNENYSNEPSIDTRNMPEFSANDLIGKDGQTWALVKEYDTKAFKKGKIMPFSATLVKLKDGAVLFVQCAHATMDGYSFFRLMEQWAALTKGESIEPMVVDQSQLPKKEAYTKAETLDKAKEYGWVKMKVTSLIRMMWDLFRLRNVKDTFIQTVSQEEIAKLKQKSSAGTHAILCAIAAREVMTRLQRDSFKVISVSDLRGHIFGVSENLMGNLSQPFATQEEFSSSLDTAALAQAIQKANDAILQSDTQERNLRLSVCASHYGLPYYWMDPCAMFSDKPESLYVNNQLKFRACELDFGTGKPLYAFPNTLSDTVKFWQPIAGGPVQIIYWGFMAKLMKKFGADY